jgi:CheY-like chemotaxis protein
VDEELLKEAKNYNSRPAFSRKPFKTECRLWQLACSYVCGSPPRNLFGLGQMDKLRNMDDRRRILLCVDDDPSSLDLRQQLLELAGFQVITTTDAKEGLELFRTRQVDAVILDYQMPGMNGGELAEAMKRIRPGIPVMIVSALPWLPEDAPRCIDAFVTKGSPNSALMDKITNLVP